MLLGQYHMERSGQFVSAKPGRNLSPGRQHRSMGDVWHLEDRGPAQYNMNIQHIMGLSSQARYGQ